MTSPDQSKGGRSRDEVLAGEYVLGVLSYQDRRVVEERMRRDRQFAAIVSRWEANLSAFADEYEVAASPGRYLMTAPFEAAVSRASGGRTCSLAPEYQQRCESHRGVWRPGPVRAV